MRQTLSWIICATWFALGATICPANAETLTRFEYTEYHMGVDVRIVAYAPDQATAERACAAAFERFAELDTIMSDYRADSELMRLCAKAGGPPVPVSKDLFDVLARSQEFARRSGGAFDVTCGPLVRLWRKARKTHILPASEEIERARALVGWQKMQLDAKKRTVRLLVPGMQLDLGGIGKGYADEAAQTVLKKQGITHALVEAGGDIVVSAPPPGQKGWKIQVANAGKTAEAPVLLFANVAVSTSGDTEQFVELGGRRYSHILDPRTGQALTDRIQVSIVAPSGILSEGLSKIVSVLGPEKGQAIVRQYRDTKAYIRFLPGMEGKAQKYEPRVAKCVARQTQTVPIHLVLLPNPKEDEMHLGLAKRGQKSLWQGKVTYNLISVLPGKQMVVYANGGHNVVARSYTGKLLWNSDGVPINVEISGLCAGGSKVILMDRGPAFGAGSSEQPRYWGGEDGILDNACVHALDSRTGRLLWNSNADKIGVPIWTDGITFLTLHIDASPKNTRRAEKGGHFPIWLEARTARNHALQWRRKLTGVPPGLSGVRRLTDNKIEFSFRDTKHYPINEFDFIRHLPPRKIVVPLSHAHLNVAGHKIYVAEKDRMRANNGE